jgi:hypothetical protein
MQTEQLNVSRLYRWKGVGFKLGVRDMAGGISAMIGKGVVVGGARGPCEHACKANTIHCTCSKFMKCADVWCIEIHRSESEMLMTLCNQIKETIIINLMGQRNETINGLHYLLETRNQKENTCTGCKC